MDKNDRPSPAHIALIGNFLPRKCGLATFTTDTLNALRERFPEIRVDLYAMDDRGTYDFPTEVTRAIPQDDRLAYSDAARAIEDSGAQALWVQHEYGIYGGAAGDFLLALLERTTLPLIVTLHTILEQPSDDERRVMDMLLRRASRVIVMAERGREILERVHGADPRTIAMIPHGVPDRPVAEPDTLKPRFGWEGRKVVLTFGLLSPGKGIETIIEALPASVAEVPDLLYVVLGVTHPNLVAHEGEAYRDRLQALANDLGVGGNVNFIDAFLEQDDLLDYLQAADVYVTPFTNPAQITSGTLSYAIGLGKPVISTPYVHATEILAESHGVLVDFGDSPAFAREIVRLLSSEHDREQLSRRAYSRGRGMIWPRVAEAAIAQIRAAASSRPRRLPSARQAPMPLPPSLRAVERMSDATGMLQHSIYSVPDRSHGYCTDDNARALILMTRIEDLTEELRDRWTTVYASFVQHAWNPETRRFRNFLSFDRTWREASGSEDSNGRALWAIGVTASDARMEAHRAWARALYDKTADIALDLGSLRAQAFAMLGAAAILEADPGHILARRTLTDLADGFLTSLSGARRREWQWFEIVLAYDNARLPEAMLRAGHALGRDDLMACGLDTLDWLIAQQISPDGRFRAIGTESFGRVYAKAMPFDQQPLEALATIEACAAAFAAKGEPRWIDEAMRAYRWFLGANDLDLPVAARRGDGCFDGLTPIGVNRNQGAESILALQLASCAISTLSKAGVAVAKSRRVA
jgi:glycosyltransferase involved in cell wall biosynthesis